VTSLHESASLNGANSHGWIGTETVITRLGNFEFRGGYPTEDAALRLAEQRAHSRAVEVYLSQMPVVSMYHVWKGAAGAGRGIPNQIVLWETSIDARTVVLTGNSETVYALCALDLERDGPMVVDIPLGVMGGITDLWQSHVVSIGPRGVDRGNGGRFVLLPPSHDGPLPDGYFVVKSPTFRTVMGLRGFPVGGPRDKAVAVLKQVRVYPLASLGKPTATTIVNASSEMIDMVFPDTGQFFEDLAGIIQHEPAERVSPGDHFLLASIGIEKGRRFAPNAARQALLRDAARLGAATARANTFSSNDPARRVYHDRQWQWAFTRRGTPGMPAPLDVDHRAAFAYIAFGVSPAVVDHVVGQSSEYLWTPRDSNGAFLDGAKHYELRLPPGIPVRLFWSVVVYDAVSRSMLENGSAATVSQYSGPAINSDGSVDLYFGPVAPAGREANWVRTVAGKGWFPLVRLCAPLPSFFSQAWRPDDIVELRHRRPEIAPLNRRR